MPKSDEQTSKKIIFPKPQPPARRNTGYNSMMHRKSRQMHKLEPKERTARKKEGIRARQALRDGDRKPNVLGGLVNFINSLKKKKEKKNAERVEGGKKGQHQRQAK